MGPGTHIVSRINNNTLPTSRTDFLALLHDIQYLQFTGDIPVYSDSLAIENAGYDLEGLIMKTGLSVKKALGNLYKNTSPLEGLSEAQTRQLGDSLMQKVLTDPIYSKHFDTYRIDRNYYAITHRG